MRTIGVLILAASFVACSSPSGGASDATIGTFEAALEALAGSNAPPAAPIILEPEVGRVFSPGNVHMETEGFVDPDDGDSHRCTDWEIWTITPAERVWSTLCISGALGIHTHLGDGVFENSHARKRQLLPETAYTMRVRFRDSSDDPDSEWSAWSEREFQTGTLSQVFPMVLLDVLPNPRAVLSAESGRRGVLLTPGEVPATLTLERVDGSAFVAVRGGADGNEVLDYGAGAEHAPVRAVVRAGSLPLTTPPFDMVFSAEDQQARVIHFPALELEPGGAAMFWVAENGGTYTAATTDLEPTFGERRREAEVPWAVEPDFTAEVVARGFTLPVSIAFVTEPDESPTAPLFYVGELYGGLKVVRNNGVVSDYAANILDFNPTGIFPGSGEQGLGAIAVEPTTGDLYVSLVYSSNPNNPAAPLYGAVDKFVSSDGGLTASARYRILDMAPEPQGPAHQPSNLTFGPDGYLYLHTGDGLIVETTQDLEQFRGKILRMTRAGAAVGSNPHYNARDGITARDYVYASGIRNAYGGAWRVSDASHYFVENGPSVDRISRLVFGRNYGYDGSDRSMLNYAMYNWNPAASPVNISFVESGLFGGSGFPVEYHGRAYITLFCCGSGPGGPQGKAITEWVIDDLGRIVDGSRAVARYSGSGIATPVALATGPDGIYYSDFFGESDGQIFDSTGSILRLQYRAPEPPPDCDGDGVPDAEELAAELSQDCTFNGLPDICDISAGRELDCDLDGQPDRCQVTRAMPLSFDDGPGPFVLTGTAQALAGAVRLTPASTSSTGSAVLPGFDPEPLKAFRLEFDARIGGGSGADGMSLAVFDSALYSEPPVFGEDGPGARALVVKLNTFNNGDGANNVQILFDGQRLGTASPSCTLNDATAHTVRVNFTGQHISVTLACAPGVVETLFDALDVPGFSPFVASLGFGGRTGGFVDEHWIDNVVLWVRGDNDSNANGTPDQCEAL